jgi:outer membrane lipoprotein-sorting protein
MWDNSRGTERTLIKILGPALWRGNGTLKVGSQLKLYNPRTNHVTVVSNSMLGDSWMGSHFTNDDLVKETRLDRHFKQKLTKKYSGKNEAGQAVTFYHVDLSPKPSAPVAWGKIVYLIWEKNSVVMPTKALYFRKASSKKPDRTLTFSHVKKMGGRLIPTRLKMTLAKKPGEHTSIIYSKIKFDLRIPDKKFTEQALKH